MELQLQLLEKVLPLVEEEQLDVEGMEQHLVKLHQIRIHLQMEDFLVEEAVVVLDHIQTLNHKLQEEVDQHTQVVAVVEQQDLVQELILEVVVVVVVV